MLYEARFVRTQCGRPNRKLCLGKFLRRSGDGLLNDHEAGAIGPSPIRTSLQDGLEGIVSRHPERTYGARRSPHWIKVKNPQVVRHGSRQGRAMVTCDQKITLRQMRQMGVRGLLVFCPTTSAPISQISAEITGGPWSACPMLNRVLSVSGVASGAPISGPTTPSLIVINSGLSRVSSGLVRSAQGRPAVFSEGQNSPLF
jgi:hypothetical protein